MEIERDISLRPHTGRDGNGSLVRLAQDWILLNGVGIGFVGHAPGSPINLIRPTDEATREEIRRVVELARSAPVGQIHTAPAVTDEEQLDQAEGRTTSHATSAADELDDSDVE